MREFLLLCGDDGDTLRAETSSRAFDAFVVVCDDAGQGHGHHPHSHFRPPVSRG